MLMHWRGPAVGDRSSHERMAKGMWVGPSTWENIDKKWVARCRQQGYVVAEFGRSSRRWPFSACWLGHGSERNSGHGVTEPFADGGDRYRIVGSVPGRSSRARRSCGRRVDEGYGILELQLTPDAWSPAPTRNFCTR
jgi:hypothetical protein